MQNHEKCHENVWILSGTSDGPLIANRLLELDYSVFASVLTYKAGQAYIDNPKLHIITGKLNNKFEIINIINKDLNNNDYLMIKASLATGFNDIVKDLKGLR